ncbi:RICIN domain-containing protein [Streptomyces bambusae]|uniref:ricin-type beta-trefoil lectin domain protein n=1 Tax=Streptomyces bambusae TaxID=1550616 RepID=UPI001CFE5678|nr:ricin-type beta-trefoil lectin domain protein [Streptomyces bambusae]MCB5168351.1 RICIN domain-containing protein [Streptomyces bambusae]
MGMTLRKTVALAALALTASLLPAGPAGAAQEAARVPGRYCLANAWGTPNISSKPCDSADSGQHWTVSGHQISLTGARGYCLANTWNTATVSTKPCNSGDQGQYWNVSGQQISLSFAPAYCLANAWGTPNISTKPCDNADPGQKWVVFDEQISLAVA